MKSYQPSTSYVVCTYYRFYLSLVSSDPHKTYFFYFTISYKSKLMSCLPELLVGFLSYHRECVFSIRSANNRFIVVLIVTAQTLLLNNNSANIFLLLLKHDIFNTNRLSWKTYKMQNKCVKPFHFWEVCSVKRRFGKKLYLFIHAFNVQTKTLKIQPDQEQSWNLYQSALQCINAL